MTVHQLFIDFMKACGSVMKLVRLINMYFHETYIKVHIGKQ
jgi:hypothetical protein